MNPIGLCAVILIGIVAGEVSAHAPTYAYVGCYRDTAINRAFPNHQPGVHGSDQCFRLATEKKLHFYGLQNGGECWLDERNRNHYNKHGESGACMGHDGGPWANSVYKINYPCFNSHGDLLCLPKILLCWVHHVQQICQKMCKKCI